MSTINKPVSPKTILSGGYEIYIASRFAETETRVGVFGDDEISFGGSNSSQEYTNYRADTIINGDLLELSFSLAEQRPEVMEILNAGTVARSIVPNSLEIGRVDTFGPGEWGFEADVLTTRYNADGTTVTISSATVLKDGSTTTLVDGVDYVASANFLGMTVIKLLTGSVLTDGDEDVATISVTYDVTPPAHQSVQHARSGVAIPFVAYLIRKGVDQAGAEMKMITVLDDVTNEKSFLNYAGDNTEGAASLACVLKGRVHDQQFINF